VTKEGVFNKVGKERNKVGGQISLVPRGCRPPLLVISFPLASRYTRQRVSSCHKEAIVLNSETMESFLEALVMINQPA
jgi:hypothetical protein